MNKVDENTYYLGLTKNQIRIQEIGSLHCKECKGICLPDIYMLDWVCQNCGNRYILKGEYIDE